MKMYLSSFRLGDHPEQLSALFGANKMIAVIANATDDLQTNEERKLKVQREIEWLNALGLHADEIDLRDYFDKADKLKEKINEYGGVWVRGGNTFNLVRAARQSGFDKIILDKNKEKDFVYAGYSAGICFLTPDLHGIELVDEPNIIPAGYNSEIIWEGLNLLDFYIAPHYQSPDHPESPLVEKEVEFLKANNMPYKALRDGEVIIRQ